MASPPEYDQDPQETREWLEALEGVLETEGPERAHFLLEQLIEKARRSGAFLPYSANTAYINKDSATCAEAHTLAPRPLEVISGTPSRVSLMFRMVRRHGDGAISWAPNEMEHIPSDEERAGSTMHLVDVLTDAVNSAE